MLIILPVVEASARDDGVGVNPNRFFGFLIPEGEGQARGDGEEDTDGGDDD
jgi:hypothetical protein